MNTASNMLGMGRRRRTDVSFDIISGCRQLSLMYTPGSSNTMVLRASEAQSSVHRLNTYTQISCLLILYHNKELEKRLIFDIELIIL